MRRAAELVRHHAGRAGLTIEEADEICDALESPYPDRIVRTIRAALGATEDPAEQVRAVAQVVNELGLTPSPAPEPLPLITEDDIHLVCWLGIVGTDEGPGAADRARTPSSSVRHS